MAWGFPTKAQKREWYRRSRVRIEAARQEVRELEALDTQITIDGVTYPIKQQKAIKLAMEMHYARIS